MIQYRLSYTLVEICLVFHRSPAGHRQELEKVHSGCCALDISEYCWKHHCADKDLIQSPYRISGSIDGAALMMTKIHDATFNNCSCPLIKTGGVIPWFSRTLAQFRKTTTGN